MFIDKLILTNYRNIEKLNLAFDTPITIFYGNNGQGKTNIVESIYMLSYATSFRTSHYKEMIKNDVEEATIEGTICSKRKAKYKLRLNQNGKILYINDIISNKLSEYIGRVKTICFTPEDVLLFKDSPSVRRNFLDKELSSLFPIYIKQLIIFKNILDERNSLLKKTVDGNLLAIIDDKMIETSYDIYKRRKWLLDKIEEFATKIYRYITNENESIKIAYKTFLDELDVETYYEKAKKIYQSSLKKDKEKMFTNYGVHKDEFVVYLNDMQIDMYASQGQQRLISLCMKLAVAEIIKKSCQEEPILILDDAFSELDQNKTKKLLNYIYSRKQTFITCTDYKDIIENKQKNNITLIKVIEGKAVERSYM